MGQISSESPAVIHVSADLYNFFSSHVRRRQSCLIMKSMSTCVMKTTQCGPKQLCSLYKTLMLIMEKRHFAWEHKDKAPEQWMKVMWSKKRGQQSVAPIMPSGHCVSLWGCVGVWSRSVGHFRTSMAQRAPTESSSSRQAQSMKECRTLNHWESLGCAAEDCLQQSNFPIIHTRSLGGSCSTAWAYQNDALVI